MKKTGTIILVLLALSRVQAQKTAFSQTVKGTVIDEQSGNILAGVTVGIENSKSAVITDAGGNFVITQVPVGR